MEVAVPTGTDLLFALPWLLLLVAAPLLLVRRVRLAAYSAPPADAAPLVSVIVPARNESVNISVCVASLLNSVYPRFEIIVVDDGSVDGTADIVRILADHSDGRVQLVQGEPLPGGWLGKPWACWQGYRRASGELLLFTDADTRHEDTLLGHAVGALRQRQADLVSVMPRQLMLGFWERLILPQIFTILSLRYHDLLQINRTTRVRDVIANGQFILVAREAYDAVGGHEAVRGDVVEDQRLAQRMVASGRSVFMAHAQELMETRMYRSLSGIVEGWSKNLALGARRASPGWLAPVMPWLIAAFLVVVWVMPPLVLLLTLTTGRLASLQGWSMVATAFSALFWLVVHAWNRVPLLYAFFYPLGAAAAAALFVRSALAGSSFAWKGRSYAAGAEVEHDTAVRRT
jgi:chlorobactene glucosyltransferase